MFTIIIRRVHTILLISYSSGLGYLYIQKLFSMLSYKGHILQANCQCVTNIARIKAPRTVVTHLFIHFFIRSFIYYLLSFTILPKVSWFTLSSLLFFVDSVRIGDQGRGTSCLSLFKLKIIFSGYLRWHKKDFMNSFALFLVLVKLYNFKIFKISRFWVHKNSQVINFNTPPNCYNIPAISIFWFLKNT